MEKYKIENIDFYQRTILNMLKLLIVFTPIFVYKYVGWYRANQEAWLKLFVMFSMGIYLLKLLKEKSVTYKKIKIKFPILLLIILIGLSFSKNGSLVIGSRDFIIFLMYFILYFLVINNLQDEFQFKSFIKLFFFTSSFVALYNFLHYYNLISYLQEYGLVISPIGQKNWTSNYLALIFPLMFCFFLLEKDKKNKNTYFLLLSIIYANLMICQSRGIWISLSLTLLFGIFLIFKFNFFNLFKENKKWLILLLITFIIITLIYSTDNPLNISPLTVTQRALSTFDEKDPSINTRILMWKVTWLMIKEKPLLGLGIGSFGMNYLDYQAKFLQNNPEYIKYWGIAREAHNEYLQMGAEIGLVGLGIFIVILFIFYNLVLNFLKEEKDSKKKLICWGLILGITCFLIHCFFCFPLHVPALGSAFFIMIAIIVAYIKNFNLPEEKLKKKEKRGLNEEKIKPNNSKLTLFYIIIVLLIMLLIIDFIVIRPYMTEVYAYKGKVNFNEGNFEEALPKYEYAAKLNPYNGRVLLNLGTTYYNLGIYGEAKKILMRSKKYYNDPNINRNLGLCYMQLKDYEKAESELKNALYLDPKLIKAYIDLAYLYAIQKKYDMAIIEWNKIFEIDPNFSEKYNVLYYIGLTYQKKEMPDKALECFVQALQLVPEGDPIEKEIEEEINKIYKSNLKN